MPRVYIRKTDKGKVPESVMIDAVTAVEKGMTVVHFSPKVGPFLPTGGPFLPILYNWLHVHCTNISPITPYRRINSCTCLSVSFRACTGFNSSGPTSHTRIVVSDSIADQDQDASRLNCT
ncbi:hemocyanin 1 [Biomphalaria glabrata]|nr:hemocyanin 1 [Biomphalaria glabrata]